MFYNHKFVEKTEFSESSHLGLCDKMVLIFNSVLYSSATDKFWYLPEVTRKTSHAFPAEYPALYTRPEVKLSQAENDILKNIMLSLGGKWERISTNL